MIRCKTVFAGTLLTAVLVAMAVARQANAAGAAAEPQAATKTLGAGFELLLVEKVRDDIGMTDAQGEKLQAMASQFYADPANAVKTLGKILTPQQIQRLKQIKLQVAGAAGLSIAEVAKALALTDQEREKLKALEAEYRDKTHAAVHGTKKKDYKQVRSIMADMRAKHLEAALQVLTPQQRKKFDKMRGPKINMDLSKL
jgi:DNA-binding transcriptional MerR regulator